MGTGPRVLIVEDDDATREMLCAALNEANFDIVAALDGLHALRTTIAKRPDVVVLDLGLPALDGGGYVRRWRERDDRAKNVPVIVMSASQDAERIANELGAVQFFKKPFDIEDLVKATEKAIGRHAHR